MPRAYSAEFRRRAIALFEAGQSNAKTADNLGITQTILYNWINQDWIDWGVIPGRTIAESKELRRARRRIRELDDERNTPSRQQVARNGRHTPKWVYLLIDVLVDARFNVKQDRRTLGGPLAGLPPPPAVTHRDVSSMAHGTHRGSPCREPRHLWITAGPRRVDQWSRRSRQRQPGGHINARRRNYLAPRTRQCEAKQGHSHRLRLSARGKRSRHGHQTAKSEWWWNRPHRSRVAIHVVGLLPELPELRTAGFDGHRW